jgi:glycosyltransferase involved in cell wall biosynthesis
LALTKQRHNLIVITNHFPFGVAESFLENEINYLVEAFDKVIVLARDVTSEGLRKSNENFSHERINPRSNTREKLIACGLYIKHFKKIIRHFRLEIGHLKKMKKPVSISILKVMIHDMTKALTTAFHINRLIRRYKLTDTVIIYSYWLTSSALSSIFVDDRQISVRRISRAHGGDVYEFRNNLQYLSFRPVLVRELTRIFAISDNAAIHLKKNIYSLDDGTIRVSRLGTKRQLSMPLPKKNSHEFLLVSCSFLLPVKRIHLLIDALSCIDLVKISWIHIGDGPLRAALENYAAEKLGQKTSLRYQFKGGLTNTDLLKFYHDNFVDLFINTSSSEGIPVTMMEAQSFGIPIVAPQIGGIPEIISAENGRLFSVTDSAKQIASLVEEILALPQQSQQQLRSNAFRNWEVNYNAEKNFPTFVAEILSL